MGADRMSRLRIYPRPSASSAVESLQLRLRSASEGVHRGAMSVPLHLTPQLGCRINWLTRCTKAEAGGER